MDRKETLIGWSLTALFVAIGAGPLGLGTHFSGERARLLAQGQRTAGTITEFVYVGGDSSTAVEDKFLVPVVRFTAASGEQITFRSTVAPRWWSDYQAGQSVAVVFDPADPQQAAADSYAEIWFAPLLCWIVGAGAVLIPPYTMWRHYRAGQK